MHANMEVQGLGRKSKPQVGEWSTEQCALRFRVSAFGGCNRWFVPTLFGDDSFSQTFGASSQYSYSAFSQPKSPATADITSTLLEGRIKAPATQHTDREHADLHRLPKAEGARRLLALQPHEPNLQRLFRKTSHTESKSRRTKCSLGSEAGRASCDNHNNHDDDEEGAGLGIRSRLVAGHGYVASRRKPSTSSQQWPAGVTRAE